MAEETLVILTTWPSVESAREAARILIEARLAACANIIPGVESIYRWKDAIETSAETLVIFKATMGSYPRFEARLKELHPYEVPEVVALRPSDGLPAYMRWVEENAG